MIRKSDFFYFDKNNHFCIPSLNLILLPGEAVAILSTRGNNISDIYNRFHVLNPLGKKTPSHPVIRCITAGNINLFPQFSAYDNFSMAEHSVIRYNKKQLVRVCENIKKQFGISTSFHTPVKRLSISEQIIILVVRAMISEMDILVCDNLISQLSIEDRSILLSIFRTMLDQGKSILYLTTKWENAVQSASRIIVTSDGEVMGEMNTLEVIENPQHLLFLISGRTLMEQNANSIDASQMLDMLYTGAEYLTNNYELNETLSVIINNVSRIVHCDSCVISLKNRDSDIIHTYSGQYHNAPALSDEFMHDYLNNQCSYPENIVYISSEDINFSRIISPESNGVKSLIIMPVVSKNNLLGLLCVFFSSIIVYDNQQFNYLKSFCREVSVVVETSRLINNSVLLQESNHRIKNNLQIIISLIAMQQLYIQQNPEADTGEILDSITNCVQNIASLHDLLTSPNSNSNNIDLSRIIECILRLYKTTAVSISIDVEDLLIPYAKATSISIIINELLANCIKHAFPRSLISADPRVHISCCISGEDLVMKIYDNGIGISETLDINSSQSIGFSILRAIIKNELHGTLHISGNHPGTVAVITIPYAMLITHI